MNVPVNGGHSVSSQSGGWQSLPARSAQSADNSQVFRFHETEPMLCWNRDDVAARPFRCENRGDATGERERERE